jgi:hypothetical protein
MGDRIVEQSDGLVRDIEYSRDSIHRTNHRHANCFQRFLSREEQTLIIGWRRNGMAMWGLSNM